MLSEANDFFWPGPDLRVLPGQGPETSIYGTLPPSLFKSLQQRLAERYRAGRVSLIARTE